MSVPAKAPAAMHWGAAPELVGPRHHFRVALMARTLAAYLPARPAASGQPSRVLDAGAGRGTLALLLARRGYAVTALDESAEFIEYLVTNCRRPEGRTNEAGSGPAFRPAATQAEPNLLLDRHEVGAQAERVSGSGSLRLVRGDVAALPFAAGAFDGAVCGEVLEHVADDGAALAGLARALRPGGILVATVPAGRERYSWLDRWAGHTRRYDLAELRALVVAHGFEVLRLHDWGFPFGLLYERLVQRPVLGRHARAGAAPGLALRVGRAVLTTRAASVLFAADRLCDGAGWGPGLLLVARRVG